MLSSSKFYYQFLGCHSLLIGLLPFFLPVYLYKTGASLDLISWFIGITGFSFCVCLYLVDHLRGRSATLMVVISFVLELVLLLFLAVDAPWYLIAIINGFYSCLYWTIQRVLFLAGGTSANSGRRFGNFQIYVLILLNIGIFVGSGILEKLGLPLVCVVSLTVVAWALWVLLGSSKPITFPESLQRQSFLPVVKVVKFSDRYNSKLIFLVDGMFLYLESYFWVISLFLFVGESFLRLGGVVIILAIILAVVFYLIKNSIDRVHKQTVYTLGVVLYIFSWVLRGSFGDWMEVENTILQSCVILVIGFATSFFRLAFNKRFFDVAEKTSMHHYLFYKSYYSQFGLAIFFVFAGFFLQAENHLALLSSLYWGVAVVAVIYFFYRNTPHSCKDDKVS